MDRQSIKKKKIGDIFYSCTERDFTNPKIIAMPLQLKIQRKMIWATS